MKLSSTARVGRMRGGQNPEKKWLWGKQQSYCDKHDRWIKMVKDSPVNSPQPCICVVAITGLEIQCGGVACRMISRPFHLPELDSSRLHCKGGWIPAKAPRLPAKELMTPLRSAGL